VAFGAMAAWLRVQLRTSHSQTMPAQSQDRNSAPAQMEYSDSSVILIGLAHAAHGPAGTILPQSQAVVDVPLYLDPRHDKLAPGRL
jgi:hypothetical protein